MEEPLKNQEGENLEQLLSFFSLNTPRALQSLEETEALLDELLVNFFTEVTEELSGLNGYYAKLHADYLDKMLGTPNHFYYEMLVNLELFKDIPLGKEKAAERKKRIELKGFQLEDLYNEWDSPEQKMEKFQDLLDLAALFERKIKEAYDFIEDTLKAGKKIHQLTQNETMNLSVELEREHEELYESSLELSIIKGEILYEIQSKVKVVEMIVWTCGSIRTAIDNNFYKFRAEISRPYLEFLLDRYTRKLETLRALPAPYCVFGEEVSAEIYQEDPRWPDLRGLLELNQKLRLQNLEQVCQQLEVRLEEQRKNPFGSDLYTMMRLNDHQRFLMWAKVIYDEETFHKNLDALEVVAKLLSLPLLYTSDKLMLLEHPELWTDEDREDHRIVEEIFERMNKIRQYRTLKQLLEELDV